MGTITRVIATLLGGILAVWLVTALIPGELSAGAVAHTSPGASATPLDVILTVHEGVLSLQAQDASLRAIFDAIGQQLSIAVVTRIPADERLTIAFDQLSLPEVLTRLRPYVNTLVVSDAKAPGTTRQLIVISKRLAGEPSQPTTQAGDGSAPAAPQQHPGLAPGAPERPQPFRFEFDPSTIKERGR